MRHTAPYLAAFLMLALIATACGSTEELRNEQLEKVAKDWSLVIRASQVIPVYPLSEDLQPCDVLLVSTPIEEQVQLYKQKGFLPLDQHFKRFNFTEFDEFYLERYGIGKDAVPPAMWQEADWSKAPRAAFPSYQFSVKTGSGMNLAIPISGVPLALGLMNSGSASGTVTIADAYTYGLDIVTTEALIRDWAEENRSLLRHYEPRDGEHHFLRVVSRVYVTGQVDVTVRNDEARSTNVGAGADTPPVELMGVSEGDAQQNFLGTIDAINKLAATQVPGGRLKIASASSRAVSMSETFTRPLVIGYVGFDLPILHAGRLGAPISTLAQLNNREVLPAQAYESVYRLAALSHMESALSEIEGRPADEVRGELDRLAELLPHQFRFTAWDWTSPTEIGLAASNAQRGDPVPKSNFMDVLSYLGYAASTVKTLSVYLPSSAPTQDPAELKQDLEDARNELKDIGAAMSRRPELMKAVDFVFFGN